MADYWDADTGEVQNDYELEMRYDDMLNEVYGEVSIAGLEYPTSRALLDLDPIAYRCGFNDWIDNEVQNGALLDEEPEMCSECDAVIDDGEGYDGRCGDCADEEESEEEEE